MRIWKGLVPLILPRESTRRLLKTHLDNDGSEPPREKEREDAGRTSDQCCCWFEPDEHETATAVGTATVGTPPVSKESTTAVVSDKATPSSFCPFSSPSLLVRWSRRQEGRKPHSSGGGFVKDVAAGTTKVAAGTMEDDRYHKVGKNSCSLLYLLFQI